jgi:chemotaxis protein MotB
VSDRRNKRGGGGGEGGEERWLLPYADMITLLLGLFIVLFAMSSVDAKQFDNVKRSLAQTFKGSVLENPGGVLTGSSGVLDPEAANQSPDNTQIAMREEASDATKKLYAEEQREFEKIVEESGADGAVKIEPSERGFIISLAGDAFFVSGSYALLPGTERKLTRVAAELVKFDRQVEIIGHTDRAPYPGPFGNEGLSSNRAHAVQQFLADHGMTYDDMRAVGEGSDKPKVKSKAMNVPENRRIEILVLAPGANDSGLPGAPEITKGIDRAKAVAAAKPAPKTPPIDLAQDVESKIARDILAPVVEASEGGS